MAKTFQKKIGCRIGKDYPAPVIDIKLSTLKAKKIIYGIKSTPLAKTNVSGSVYCTWKQEEKELTFDVIIVGAGISGTFMSSLLKQQRKSVLIIEKSGGIGGEIFYKTNKL